MDLEKEILQLKAKISELEASKKNNLFGSTYNNAGSSSADFLIKTKGKVKIQYGSKFIDLIKDGKINVNFEVDDDLIKIKYDGSLMVVNNI